MAKGTEVEIDRIMNEIHALEEEMGLGKGSASTPEPALSLVATTSEPASEPSPEPSPASDASTGASEPTVDPLEDFRGSGGGGSDEVGLEDALSGLTEEEEAPSTPRGKSIFDSDESTPEAEVRTMKIVETPDSSAPETAPESFDETASASADVAETASAASAGSTLGEDPGASTGSSGLELAIQGDYQVRLRFQAEGQTVDLRVEGGVLVVGLSDGAEFRVPLRTNRTRLRAA